MNEISFSQKQQELFKQIAAGEKAAVVLDVVGGILDRLQDDVCEEFKNFKISNYQNIDNTALLVLNLKCKIFEAIKSQLKVKISNGMIASEDARRNEEQRKHA